MIVGPTKLNPRFFRSFDIRIAAGETTLEEEIFNALAQHTYAVVISKSVVSMSLSIDSKYLKSDPNSFIIFSEANAFARTLCVKNV
jgi:hypothetical protein